MKYVPEMRGSSPKHLPNATHIITVPGKTGVGCMNIKYGPQYINTSAIIHLPFPTKLFSVKTIQRWNVEQENFLHGNVSTSKIMNKTFRKEKGEWVENMFVNFLSLAPETRGPQALTVT